VGIISKLKGSIEAKKQSYEALIAFGICLAMAAVCALVGVMMWIADFIGSIPTCFLFAGLFALAAFMAEQRSKEISIRKVLGASAGNIVRMLSVDFLKLVLIASLIAFPVAWWAMHKWLQDFAYRVNMGWWVFAIAGISSVIIALATISFQAIKAAMANPVKSLRTE